MAKKKPTSKKAYVPEPKGQILRVAGEVIDTEKATPAKLRALAKKHPQLFKRGGKPKQEGLQIDGVTKEVLNK